MSDVMLIGVLRMPPDLWNGSQLDVNQRHSRYIQAADRIESDAERIEALEQQLKAANGRIGRLESSYSECIDDMCSWADYAGDYFKEKHNIDGDLAKHNSLLNEMEFRSVINIKRDAVMEFVEWKIKSLGYEDQPQDTFCSHLAEKLRDEYLEYANSLEGK